MRTAEDTIYILGAGAVGFPLAVFLANARRRVVAVRTSREDVAQSAVAVSVHDGDQRVTASVDTVSLSRLSSLKGTIVVTAKAQANGTIARQLQDKGVSGPVVLMQNGLGIEKPFLDFHFWPIYRCVLYLTSQARSENAFTFRPVSASAMGVVRGDTAGLETCIQELTTEEFPFRAEANIEREVWKKVIINSVFNSICPLLDIDNGIFARDEAVAKLAREIVGECIALTTRLDMGLSEEEIVQQLMRVSRGSEGQLISTLQDMRSGRETEIEFLNLAIARVGAAMQPAVVLPRTEMLGRMVLAKSLQHRGRES